MTYYRKGLEIGWQLAKGKVKNRIHKFCANPLCHKEFDVPPCLDRVRFCSCSCSNKGRISPNRGKKASIETRKRQSLAKLGICGPKHWNWRGGSSNLERVRFRDQLQKRVFERDNYTCRICGEKGRALQVDHIKSWSNYPDLRFELQNCRTLCMKCHYRVTFNKEMPEWSKTWGHNFNHLTKEVLSNFR